MSFSQSDYRNIPSSGVIPSELLPADEFSFAYTFQYEKDVDPDAGINSDIHGHIVIELRDTSGALKATFDAKETYHLQIYSLAPGLAEYDWNWDINEEKFSATDANGGAISTEEQESLGAVPASGNGETDRTAYVQSTFYSLIFKLAVDAGDTLKIKFHDLSAGAVVDRAELQIATRRGGSPPALFNERLGVQLRALSVKGQTRVLRSRRTLSPLTPEQMEWNDTTQKAGLVCEHPLTALALHRQAGGRVWVFGVNKTTFELYQSSDEGETFTQIMAQPSTITPLASCFSRDGSRQLVYGLDGNKTPAFQILKNGADGWTASASGPCALDGAPDDSPGQGLPTSKIQSLEVGEAGSFRMMATDAQGDYQFFVSRDGQRWSQTPLADGGGASS